MPANPLYRQPIAALPEGYDANDIEYVSLSTIGGTRTNIHNPVTNSTFYLLGLQGGMNTANGQFHFEMSDGQSNLSGEFYSSANTVLNLGGGGVPICKSTASKSIGINTTSASGFFGLAQFLEVTG